MEAFYQESGRAGRDQLPSRSILYYGMDDRSRMEFILSNAGRKKSQSSSSQDSLLKRSLDDFNKMIEYCEGHGCRRKKILASFGEQVHASICGKSCDACKHPSLVAKYLEELACTPGHGQKNGLFPVFISSLSNSATECQESEFWNRDGEEIYSDEDISDADDDEVMNSLTWSKYSSKSRLNEKIEFLQRAEESYYQKRGSNKQTSGVGDKKFVSEALREVAKERLSGALRQAYQRLGNLLINYKTAATVLENECYRKYGKVGKTFYNSQVASTVRWLSSSNSKQIIERVGTDSVQINDTSEPEENVVSVLPTDKGTDHVQGSKEEENGTVQSEAASKSAAARIFAEEGVHPPITVAEKGEESQSNRPSRRDTEAGANAEKRMRLQ